MRIAIIPARGGSKRIPRKNIKPFAGRPMLAYAIGAARASGLFEHIVVSTDDAEIAAAAVALGAEVPFMRPAELSDDHTATIPVLQHAIGACRALGWDADQVCCIYPGVPMLQAADLGAALALLEDGAADYAFTVAAFPAAIQRALRRSPQGSMAPFNPEHVLTRTQDLEPAYYDAGQFYWGRVAAWLGGVSPHHNGRGLVIPEWRAVDIDTPDDWRRAELLYQALHAPA
ncbi:pseudaminic acid cytidylyltransferase [Janthinobacterium sp.]|uniref:pseudaminic acid cytidylyltransferase n=1 Tax=Janthinobacterium sp. TaxID=1871054 RepID=UPI00293D3149|nr:pseudaminic acid cytidylyltransferase [Janthinobacterium sp.]